MLPRGTSPGKQAVYRAEVQFMDFWALAAAKEFYSGGGVCLVLVHYNPGFEISIAQSMGKDNYTCTFELLYELSYVCMYCVSLLNVQSQLRSPLKLLWRKTVRAPDNGPTLYEVVTPYH